MYRPMGEEACSDHVRLTIKHTFIEYQCLDEDSRKLQRCNSDPCLPNAAFFPSVALSSKSTEALTPTTCSSVNGDDIDESPPPSPISTDECDAITRESGYAFHFGSKGLPPPPPPPPLLPPPHFSVHDATGKYQAMAPLHSSCTPLLVFSTCPQAAPAAPMGHSNDVRAGAQRNYRGISTDSDLEFQMTLMVRNLSQHLTQADLVQHLIGAGYRGLFDFIYMPMNLRAPGNFGYAFVNFKSHTIAVQVMARLQGLELGDALSSLQWNVGWSTCQGFAANVDRYRNSPLMHELVPVECKPSVYDGNSNLAIFPKPTKAIPKPRIHRTIPKDVIDSE